MLRVRVRVCVTLSSSTSSPAVDVYNANVSGPLLFAAGPWRSYGFRILCIALNWFNPTENGSFILNL